MAANPLRIPDELWRLVRTAAGAKAMSANAYVVRAVRAQLLRDARTTPSLAEQIETAAKD